MALGDVGEFLNQSFQVGDALLIGFVLGVLGLDSFGANFAIGTVVAGVVSGLAVVQIQNTVGDAVEQVAIVRDNEHGTAEALEEVVEPGQSQVVEVIARFVEDEEVGVTDEGVGHAENVLFTAGKQADLLVLSVGESEGIEQGLSAGFEMVAAAAVEKVAGGLILMKQLIHLFGRAICYGGFFVAEVGFEELVFAEKIIGDGQFGIEFDMLGDVTDAGVRGQGNGSGVGLFLSAENAEDGGFSGAVGADESDLAIGVEFEGEIF